MIYNTITFSYIANKGLPEQVTLTGEQHWPGSQSRFGTSVHLSSSSHPPLLLSHDCTQRRSPVASHVVQIVPGGHGCSKQAMVCTQNKNQRQ